MNITATDFLVQGIQKFFYRCAAIEAYNLIRPIQEVNRYCMWQGMMVGIFH